GQRFSVHRAASCASRAELEALRPHAASTWSLSLEGALFDDQALPDLPDLRHLEVLELEDSRVRGPGLAILERLSRLRVLRIQLAGEVFNCSDGPPLPALTNLDITNLPDHPWGFERWGRRLPALKVLLLEAKRKLYLDGPLPDTLEQLTLRGKRL